MENFEIEELFIDGVGVGEAKVRVGVLERIGAISLVIDIVALVVEVIIAVIVIAKTKYFLILLIPNRKGSLIFNLKYL